MTDTTSKYTDFEGLRAQAIALRRTGLSRRQIRDRLHIDNNDLLNRLLAGEPAPEWTKRPNAKDDLRDKARELRRQGWTYDRIQAELGCSKSSISLWVRDLPRPEPRHTPEERQGLMNKGLARLRAAQDAEHKETRQAATRAIGRLTDRELLLVGTALYWAEGSKSKPYRRTEVLQFINSDANVIRLYLRWLKLLGVTHDRLTMRVSIHESADVQAAEQYWADIAGVEVSALSKATLKRHNPRTVRKNITEAYHGCLIIYVRKSADLYRRMEGTWYGIVLGATQRPD
jgi:hypothetical protein